MENNGAKIRFYINGEELLVGSGVKVSGLLDDAHGVEMPCGGRHACGKCMVYAEGDFSEPSETEKNLLGEEKLKQGVRLACFLETVPEGKIRAFKKMQEGSDSICLDAKGTAGELEAAPADASRRLYRHLGAAVDIGTTTIAASLYADGVQTGSMGAWNPQAVFGADVISRIEASLEGKREELAQLVRNAVSVLLEKLAESAGEKAERIETAVITGNTAMLYFLTGRDPRCLSRAPFEADELFGTWMSGEELGLSCREAKVYLPPCISAFVGADITTALLGSGICEQSQCRMMVDVGTNGEIALFWKDRLICCSTAAGPAFEGAGLSCGMRGIGGAVDHVKWENGRFLIHVIGEQQAQGICGSGVIDGVAALLESGLLDETGYLEEDIFFDAEKKSGLSAGDIRQVQLAKSAIRAGMETMLYLAGIDSSALEQLYVAGGFGAYMSVPNARKIGLFPGIDDQKVRICGNAALAGAERILNGGSSAEEAEALAHRAETVNLGASEAFQDLYMEHMMFEI